MGDAWHTFADRGLVPRRAAEAVAQALAEAQVVLVNGARQAGKMDLPFMGTVIGGRQVRVVPRSTRKVDLDISDDDLVFAGPDSDS